MKVLIISAWADERQHHDQLASIRSQQGVDIEHRVLSGLSALHAEQAIFRTASECSREYDLMIRLDGDMVFGSSDVVANIVAWFASPGNRHANRLTIPVDDYFTSSLIIGLHAWRAGATPSSALLEPPKPESWIDAIDGELFKDARLGTIYHAHGPSPMQAFRFGWHRAVKAVALGPIHVHWRKLGRVARTYEQRAYPRDLGFSLLGVAVAVNLIPGVQIDWDQNDYQHPDWRQLHAYLEDNYDALEKQYKLRGRLFVWKCHFKAHRNWWQTLLMMFGEHRATDKLIRLVKKHAPVR